MNILWSSNSPMVGSGYGVQTALFTKAARDAGHNVLVYGMHGHKHAVLTWDEMAILPGGDDVYGRDMLVEHVQHYKPDVHVLLFDVWPFEDATLKAARVSAWVPVDHDPIPPQVTNRLPHCQQVWAMSRFGEAQMKARGLKPYYVPHGVDMDLYQPMDRANVRAALKLADDQLYAVMVAAHKGFPMRKNFDRVLKAWAAFVKTHPKAVLYIHTNPTGSAMNNHVDLEDVATFYGIPQNNLRFPNPYLLKRGYFGETHLNVQYNAADVFILPSMGEGFGIPALEAQAAGCPVIVSDFTAQSELAGPGYKVPVYDDDRWYTMQGSEQAIVRPSELINALEWAAEQRGNDTLRQQSREFASEYEVGKVWREYMEPAMQDAAKDSLTRKARTAQRLALRQRVQTEAVAS